MTDLFSETQDDPLPAGVWWHDLKGPDPARPLDIHLALQKAFDEQPDYPCFYFIPNERHVYLTADEARASLRRCLLPVRHVSNLEGVGVDQLSHQKCIETVTHQVSITVDRPPVKLLTNGG